MSQPILIREKVSPNVVVQLAEETFGDMAKIVVDVEQEVMTAGGELHADGEEILLQQGSIQENVWGANYFPRRSKGKRLEYEAMINIRPKQGNRGQGIQSEEIRDKVRGIVENLFGSI